MKTFFDKLWNAPNAFMRALAEKMVISWLRDGLAGKKGAGVERTLVFLKGRKTLIGFWFGMAGILAWTFNAPTALVASLGTVGGVFAAVGIVDKATQTPGRPDFLADSVVYKVVADNAGLLASGIGAAFVAIVGPGCVAWEIANWSLSCAGQINSLIVISVFFMYLGVLDAGFLSRTSQQVKFDVYKHDPKLWLDEAHRQDEAVR